VRIIWSEIAQATFVRCMVGQAAMMAVNRAVEALADDPAPPGASVRGACRRLRVGPYRVLYESTSSGMTTSSPGSGCRRCQARCGLRPAVVAAWLCGTASLMP